MGMTLKELLTKGEGTLSAQEAKTLAAQCRMDVETVSYTHLDVYKRQPLKRPRPTRAGQRSC